MTSAPGIEATCTANDGVMDGETRDKERDISSDTTGALPAPPSDAQIAAHVEGEVPLGKVPEATSTNGSASSHAVEPLRQTCLVSCDKSVSKPTSKRVPSGKPRQHTTRTPQKAASATAGASAASGTKAPPSRFAVPPPKVAETPSAVSRMTRTAGKTPSASSRYGLRSATPAKKALKDGGLSRAGAQTPREAAILAKKQLTERKQREAALHKRQQDEMKRAALAKQAELKAERQRSLQERQKTAQRQRLATAAARQAAREKQAEARAQELRSKMAESKELNDTLKREERLRRRISLDHRSEAWGRTREHKKKQQKALRKEQKCIMEGHSMFLEAKDKVRLEEKHEENLERIWRARQGFLHKRLDMGMKDVSAYEACELRRARLEDQAALEEAAQEENRRRRESAQWARNKQHLDNEIARGMGKSLDPVRLIEELYLREESRKEERQYKEAQNALRRQSMARRRLSDMRRAVVEANIRARDREREADMQASIKAGDLDAKAYREVCIRRQRESLDGRRKAMQEEKAMDQVLEELNLEIEGEEKILGELVRADIQAHKEELAMMEKAEEEFRRREMIRERELKQDSAVKQKQEQDTERRLLMEDRDSVAAHKRQEEEAELERLEALRELPSETTKLEILEAIWNKQKHPAADAAARGRNRTNLRTVQEGVHEEDEEDSFEIRSNRIANLLNNSRVGTIGSSSSSSSSGMGIQGRVSMAGSLDSILDAMRKTNDSDSSSADGDGEKIAGQEETVNDVGDVRDLGGFAELEGGVEAEEPGGLDCSAVSFVSESQVGLLGNVRLEEDDGPENNQIVSGHVSEDLGWGDNILASISAAEAEDGVDDPATVNVDISLNISENSNDDGSAVVEARGEGKTPAGDHPAEMASDAEDTGDASASSENSPHVGTENGEKGCVAIYGGLEVEGNDAGVDVTVGEESGMAASAALAWGELSGIESQASLSMTMKEPREQDEGAATQGMGFVAEGESFADDSAVARTEDGERDSVGSHSPVVRMLTFSPTKHATHEDNLRATDMRNGDHAHDDSAGKQATKEPIVEPASAFEGSPEEPDGRGQQDVMMGGEPNCAGREDGDNVLMLSRSGPGVRASVTEASHEDENGREKCEDSSPTGSLESLEHNGTLASLDGNDVSSIMMLSGLNASAIDEDGKGCGVPREAEEEGHEDRMRCEKSAVGGTPTKLDRGVEEVGGVAVASPATPITPNGD